ncbi:hypothetical protein [Shewanella algae]|uniref:hypothetical protein n=1 Tax=Shewanella algae TaxID=38313 RepID=UPI001BF16FCA|nr:hypothetical protein [Shewanella algae]BCV29217.1 hypothetical protein TUM3811_30770 [Shewanella algae]
MQESLAMALQKAREWLESIGPEQLVQEYESLSGEVSGVPAVEYLAHLRGEYAHEFSSALFTEGDVPRYVTFQEFWNVSDQRSEGLGLYPCNDDNYAVAA